MEQKQKAQGLSAQELSLFCGQLALILKSGISLEDGADALCEDSDGGEKTLMAQIAESLSEHSTLHDALEKTGAFPDYMVRMIDIGEKSGKQEEVLKGLSDFYDREDLFRKSLLGAVCYPLLLMLMMGAVLAMLVWKVLPIFRQVVSGFGLSASAAVMSVIGAGQTLGVAALVLVAVLAAATAVVYGFLRTGNGLPRMQGLFRHIPFLKNIFRKRALSRFASVMQMMFASGYRTGEALDMVPGILGDKEVSAQVEVCRAQLHKDRSLAEALSESGLFGGLAARMVRIGFQTGSVDTVMGQIAERYDREAEDALESAVSMVEPVLVGLLTVLIGAVLLAVMLPLLGVMSAIG
jgi:type IV pilus assembly protein PilC